MTLQRILASGGWRAASRPDGSFRAYNPESGDALPLEYPVSSWGELDELARAGARAAEQLERTPVDRRVQFFEILAGAIERHAPGLAEAAHLETGLPASPRFLEVEIPRTVRQLRMASEVLREDTWRCRVVDEPARLVSEFHPIGTPVVVIGPGNFPFAFNSVAGGDFVAALAAGNPVLAKGHPGHPETTRLLAELCAEAASDARLPPGSAQMFYHCTPDAGLRLVAHPLVGAVAFTGSRAAGLALKASADAAGTLFYGELSAANPVFVLPGALAERGPEIARELFASFTMGCGQFCTKPALVVLPAGEPADRFTVELAALVRAAGSQILLSRSIVERFEAACETLRSAGAREVALGRRTRQRGFVSEPRLFAIGDTAFLRDPARCQTEAFGPMTLLVSAASEEGLIGVANAVDGSLTASVYLARASADTALFTRLRGPLVRRSGRFMVNKMPTGVTVSPAMHHGGPYPATTHPGFTSVGLPRAMLRFMALKCFDGVPAELRALTDVGKPQGERDDRAPTW